MKPKHPASLQKLFRGNNIFTLYFAPTTKTKSKTGHNLAKIMRMITNIEPDLYFTILCLCWGFTVQSTQWGHVERGQFT